MCRNIGLQSRKKVAQNSIEDVEGENKRKFGARHTSVGAIHGAPHHPRRDLSCIMAPCELKTALRTAPSEEKVAAQALLAPAPPESEKNLFHY